ncbi:MAG TPA: histidine-type phosphatase [Terracidiphilus sp.]|jgi:4-phytase/acid phosphatase
MKRISIKRFYLIACCSIFMMLTGCISSYQNGGGNGSGSQLLSVVVISRHGIRSPTDTQAKMNLFTQQPEGFPLWPYPADTAGNLSTVGQQNAALLGAWYRDFYAAQGILPAKGSCPAAGTVYVYADTLQRTLVTAQGYVNGMFQTEALPDCGIQVVQYSPLITAIDPYIQTARAGIANCAINTTQDLAAFNARIGGAGNVASLINTYSPQLQMLQTVTQCCKPTACTPTANPCTLLDLPTTVNTTGVVSFASGSLFDVADTLSESYELQYGQGMPSTGCSTTPGAQCVGWGAIPPGELQDLTKLHVLNMVDLTSQLPSFAQVGSTNLMWQTVGTMDQTLSGVRNPDMLAPVGSTFTLFVAHDENISAIAGFLGGVTWKAEGFAPNDPGPAGALVFELRKENQSGDLIVRLYYVIASLDQMRNNTILTLEFPPQRIPLAIPACGGRFDCPYSQFKSYITANVAQECIYTPASHP